VAILRRNGSSSTNNSICTSFGSRNKKKTNVVGGDGDGRGDPE
jgi:hypothetical protein